MHLKFCAGHRYPGENLFQKGNRKQRLLFEQEFDIYDQLLLVSFVKRIRGEQKFDSHEELAAQLKEDEQTVLDLFEKEAE